MKLIPIADKHLQRLQIPLPEGEILTLVLEYAPLTKKWLVDIKYPGFSLLGQRVCNSVNLLKDFSQLIPFGIRIAGKSDKRGAAEPFLINDFKSGRIQFYILNKEEVETITEEIYSNGSSYDR